MAPRTSKLPDAEAERRLLLVVDLRQSMDRVLRAESELEAARIARGRAAHDLRKVENLSLEKVGNLVGKGKQAARHWINSAYPPP